MLPKFFFYRNHKDKSVGETDFGLSQSPRGCLFCHPVRVRIMGSSITFSRLTINEIFT